MKKVTYSEEFFLGRLQSSLQKGLLQLLLKKHMDYIYGNFFVSKINLTYNDRNIDHALGSCMAYLLVCYILLQ